MATIKLAIDARSLLATAKRVEQGLYGIKNTAETTFHRLNRAATIALGPLKMMIKISAALKASMIALGIASVGAAGDYEMFNQQLRTVIATKKDADQAFKESIEFSVRTPFTPDDIIRTRVELEAVGVRGSQAVERVASAAAAMNREMGDVAAAVKSLETEPLRRLGIHLERNGEEFLFKFRDKVGEAQKIAAKGFEEAQAVLLGIFETKYSGGLDRMSITWQGLISTLKGAVKDLRAEFGAGFLDQSKLIVNDLIEGSKKLKQYAGEAGREFGDEMIIARAYILAGFDTALKIAGQIKDAMRQEGGLGEVILEAFRLGTTLLSDTIVTAFEISLPLWKTIGTILGQGVLDAIYRSNIPGSGFAREMAISANLKTKDIGELRDLASQFKVETEILRPWQVRMAWDKKPFEKQLKSASELASDLSREIIKLSVEEQIAFAEFDPGAAISKSIDESRKKITDAISAMGAETVAQLQQFEDNLANVSGQEAIDLTRDFTQNLQQRLGEGNELIKDWRKKLDTQTAEVVYGPQEEEMKSRLQKEVELNAEAQQQIYDDTKEQIERVRHMDYLTRLEKIRNLEIYRDSHAGTLEQVAEAERALNEEIIAYQQSRIDQMDVYHAELREKFEDTFLYLSENFANTARSIEGSMANGFDSMLSEGERWKDAMTGFARDVSRAFSRMASEMAAQAAMLAIMQGLSGLGGGGGNLAALSTAGGPSGMGYAFGAAFYKGRLIPMQTGAILNSPTYFPLSGGDVGLMGEAGPEGVLPLRRGKGGKLGVESPAPQVTVNPTPVKVVFVRNQKEAALEAQKSDEGKAIMIDTLREYGVV